MTLWLKGGKLLTDGDGHPIDCDDCSCPDTPPVPPCCDGTTAQRLYLYVTLFATADTAPFGCETMTFCRNANPLVITGGGAYYCEPAIIPFWFGAGSNSTTYGTVACFPWRLTLTCDGGAASVDFAINFLDGMGWIGTGLIGPSCPPFTSFGCQGFPYAFCDPYLTDHDPRTGIVVPDGTVLPYHMTFNVTTLGHLYSCRMLYVPNILGFTGGPAQCYRWIGCYQNCNGPGNVDWVELDYDPGTGDWELLVLEIRNTGFPTDDVIRMFTGGGFRDSGISVDKFVLCGDGVTPSPWSLTP